MGRHRRRDSLTVEAIIGAMHRSNAPARRLLLASSLALAACSGKSPLEPADAVPTGGTGTATGGNTGAAGAGVGAAGTTGAAGAAGTTTSGAAGAGGQAGTSPPAACAASLPAEIRTRVIAFDSDRANFHRQLYRMRADGSEVTPLLSDAFTDKEPAFSPDGERLAFTSDRAGAPQIFVLELATSKVTKLTARSEGANEPSFSRDGKLVAFHSGASVYVVSADGGGERLVATGLDDYNAFWWPQFSADGSELVYDRNNEIDATTIGTSQQRMIVQNTATEIKQPAVSPDGTEVAYQARCFFSGGPVSSIWTTPFSSNTEACGGRRVTPADETFMSLRPAWGTKTYLAYERVDPGTNLGSIAVISREAGSTPCVVAASGADNRNPSWAP